jgi:hypothetical protein
MDRVYPNNNLKLSDLSDYKEGNTINVTDILATKLLQV